MIKENKRIIFNGNNYSAEWEKEAGKRGLLNLKNTRRRAAAARHEGSRRPVREVQGSERARAARALRDHARAVQQDREHRRPADGADGEPLHPAGGVRVSAAGRGAASRRSKSAGAKSVEGKKSLDKLTKLVDKFKAQADKLEKSLEHESHVGGEARQALPRRRDSEHGGAARTRRRARESSCRTNCGRSPPTARCCSSSKRLEAGGSGIGGAADHRRALFLYRLARPRSSQEPVTTFPDTLMAKRKTRDGHRSSTTSTTRDGGRRGRGQGPATAAVAAPRSGAVALPELRALGHHGARAAGRPRRLEAGPAPHPLHDVAAEPDGRRQAPQVREGRRRRDGQLSPARRRRAVRDARPHGAVVLAALPARGRLGQLRIARRRQRRRDAVHRVPPRAHQRRDADRDRAGRRSTSGRTTTARRPSRSSCRRASRISSSTARRASPSAWRPTSRRTTSARCARRSSSCSTTKTSATRSCAGTSKGPTSPPAARFSTPPEELKAIYRTGSGSIRLRGTWDIGPETRSTKTIYIDSIPYTVNKSQLVERIAEVVHQPEAAASCST